MVFLGAGLRITRSSLGFLLLFGRPRERCPAFPRGTIDVPPTMTSKTRLRYVKCISELHRQETSYLLKGWPLNSAPFRRLVIQPHSILHVVDTWKRPRQESEKAQIRCTLLTHPPQHIDELYSPEVHRCKALLREVASKLLRESRLACLVQNAQKLILNSSSHHGSPIYLCRRNSS